MVLGLLSFSCDDESNGVATNLPMIQPPLRISLKDQKYIIFNFKWNCIAALQTLLTEEAMDQASGQSCTGIVNCAIVGLDGRMAEINSRSEEFNELAFQKRFKRKLQATLQRKCLLSFSALITGQEVTA